MLGQAKGGKQNIAQHKNGFFRFYHQRPGPGPIMVKPWLRILWLIAIVVVSIASLLPDDSAPIRVLSDFRFGDKVEHVVAYAFLAFLPAIHERLKWMAIAAPAVVGLGVGLEFCQLYCGWRAFEIGDIVADTFGVCVGLAVGVPMKPMIKFTSVSGTSE